MGKGYVWESSLCHTIIHAGRTAICPVVPCAYAQLPAFWVWDGYDAAWVSAVWVIHNSLLFFMGCSLELFRQKHPAPSCHVSQRAFDFSSVVDATAGEQTPGNVLASRLSISIYKVFACSKDMHSPEYPKSSGDSCFLGKKIFVSGRILKVISRGRITKLSNAYCF